MVGDSLQETLQCFAFGWTFWEPSVRFRGAANNLEPSADSFSSLERLIYSTNLVGRYLPVNIEAIFATSTLAPSFASYIILTFYWY